MSYNRDYTPEKINALKDNEIFVFGSNLAGQHGGGAAYAAYRHFGARMGIGVGLAGQSYAIPTMQGGVETIAPYVDQFIEFARHNPDKRFLVTRIGCGIAGFTDGQIAPLFTRAIDIPNIILPREWVMLIEKTEKNNGPKLKIFNVVILDESGSMSLIEEAAIEGFNSALDAIREAQREFGDRQTQLVTLVTFNTCGQHYTKSVYDMVPVGETRHIDRKTYRPNGGTPLLDAIGTTVSRMRKFVKNEHDAVVAVTIITDGEENCSTEYTYGEIARMIAGLSEEGWSFSYVGANQDSVKVASELNIKKSRNFDYTSAGMKDVFEDEKNTRMAFSRAVYAARSCGSAPMSKADLSALYDDAVDEVQRSKKKK